MDTEIAIYVFDHITGTERTYLDAEESDDEIIKAMIRLMKGTAGEVCDAITRNSVEFKANAFLLNQCSARKIRQGRGYCDDSNNHPNNIDRGHLVLTVVVHPPTTLARQCWSFSNASLLNK